MRISAFVFCCLLLWGGQASAQSAAKVKVISGSVAGYVFSPKPVAGASFGSSTTTTTTTTTAAATTTTTTTTTTLTGAACFKVAVSTSSITTEGTVTTKAALSGLNFVGIGSVSGGLFTGVLHLEHCDVMDLNNSAGSANVINNNKCPAARGGSGYGSTTYSRCPNSWASSTIYGAGAGACLLLTAANIAAGGPNGGTYFAYVEVKDLPVTSSSSATCPGM